MGRFAIGQVVRVLTKDNGGFGKGKNKLGIILAELLEPSGYWAVAMRSRRGEDTVITYVLTAELDEYINHCWNCGYELNSAYHRTHEPCKWVECPNCGACREGGCKSVGLHLINSFKTSSSSNKKVELDPIGFENIIIPPEELDSFMIVWV